MSAASRPRAIRMRPMRGQLCRASKVNHRPPKKASNQALKSMGARFGRDADVAQKPIAITSRDIEASAKRYRQMSEIATYPEALIHRLVGRPRLPSQWIAKYESVMHEITDALDFRPAARDRSKCTPSKIRQQIRLAIAATREICQGFKGKVLNR
jgi:hypothetical protein